MKLPQLPQDKANHFVYGVGIFIVCLFFVSPVYAFAIVATIGALKEIVHDKIMGKGTPDFWDFVATAAGGLAGFVCTYF